MDGGGFAGRQEDVVPVCSSFELMGLFASSWSPGLGGQLFRAERRLE